MRITPKIVSQFEGEQREFGTETAIYNLLWLNAAEQLSDIGVLHVTASRSYARRALEEMVPRVRVD